MAASNDSAVREIAETLRFARERRSAAHLLVGAGCSKSAGIPLASEIVREIRERHGERFRAKFGAGAGTYGGCMNLLTVNERRALLSGYIEKARINWGHLAIAQMMAEGIVERVLTVNFDNLLARACGLLGLYPAIYDFATAPTDDRTVLVSPAIVHLHGQGYGVRRMNTDEETRAHAQRIAPVVKQSLNEHPLLVIGYSGDADYLLTVLKEDHREGEKLYWLGRGDSASADVLRFMEGKEYAAYLGGCDADLTLIELARAAGCWPPKVFIDPAGHLLDEIGPVAEFPSAAVGGASTDLLASVRASLERHREALKEDATASGVVPLVLEGRVAEAADRARSDAEKQTGLEQEDATGKSSDLAAWLAFENGYRLQEAAEKAVEPREADRLFQDAERQYAEALRMKPDMHEALNNWANVLLERATRAEAAAAASFFDAAAEKYAQALRIKPAFHATLFSWGNLLLERAKRAEGAEAASFLEEADRKLSEAVKLDPGATYNLACLAALRGEPAVCEGHLRTAEAAGTLPSRDHLLADPDLISVRETSWFRAMIARLEAKSAA